MFRRKLLLSALCVMVFFCSFNGIHAEEIKFQDVGVDHWAIDTIQWAVKEKIVDGYPDNTFKPEQVVGQKEFITLLIRTFKPSDFSLDDPNNTGEWSYPYTHFAFSYGWYVIVPFHQYGSDISLARGQAAKIIADATGKNYNQQDSIRYLLDHGIVEGKADNSFEGFKEGDPLTRAEALTMIKRVHSKLDKLQKSPKETVKYEPKSKK
ncbi:S-layer homology domain-containing protein [Paenibacillus elgii]|uniref:S-layer homology domain-containing protein n=1 Tax=Paenibacillus elgii TaxID=189691 RepID=UPI00203D03FF|nr:S-layer homology domain-containing protein [Paenibacillus elgii]MCM3270410.1 S-layer homology domain-containing protein [Paenibacillus elgii]